MTVLTTKKALGPLLGSSLAASMVFASLTGALGGGAGLFNILFPTKQVQEVPWEGLSAALSENVNEYQKNVGEALTKIQTDFDTFYSLVSNGGFSQVGKHILQPTSTPSA